MKRKTGRSRKNKTKLHKRRQMGETIIALMIILIVSTAHAFTFDVWESGMDADTIIMTAMKNDIPLAKEGWLGNPKHFDKRLCVPHRETATAYQYIAELLGKTAKITLHLTKEKKRLMKVSIRWGQGQSGELLGIIEKIVKDKKPISKRRKSIIFIKTTSYLMDKETEIDISTISTILTMTYNDLPLVVHDEKTESNKKKLKKNKAVAKDSGKF